MKEELLSLEEAAAILDLSPRALEHWIKAGKISPVSLEGKPYFRPKDLGAFFEANRPQPLNLRKKILIIEDDPLVGDSLKNLLEKSGFDTTVVFVGLAALDFMLREDFDLIIADVRMPGMNGIETLRAVRELEKQFSKPGIPEVILTAYDDPEVKREAERLGVAAFILKPFEVDPFISILKKILEGKLRENPVEA